MKRLLLFLLTVGLYGVAEAGTLYVSTTGATTNSGSRDEDAAALSGTPGAGTGAYATSLSTNVVRFESAVDLSGVVTSGSSQDTIYLASATNSNMKIFWITAVNDAADTLTVHANMTQSTASTMTWTIGGRHVLTNASIEGSLRAGDTLIFNNSPASAAGVRWTFRNSGTYAAGHAKIKGATGTRPQLITTDTANVINVGQNYVWIENLELIQQGASGAAVVGAGSNAVLYNVKISDAGGAAVAPTATLWRYVACEFSGVGGDGISHVNTGATNPMVVGSYVHDVGGDCMETWGTPLMTVVGNIFDTCAAIGLYEDSGLGSVINNHVLIYGNTIYKTGQDGLKTFNTATFQPVLMNNIFKDNGDTGTEYNINFGADFARYGIGISNIFNISGARGGGNLNNYTASASDLTTDPLFTDGDAGNFALQATSPAKAAGYPGAFLGGSTGYLDIGAVQRQESGSGGGKSIFFWD